MIVRKMHWIILNLNVFGYILGERVEKGRSWGKHGKYTLIYNLMGFDFRMSTNLCHLPSE